MATSPLPSRLPITIITGFTGSGKTTLLLNLIPQLRASNPSYRLALIKNEIGDVAVDTALASAAELTGSKELLGDCICCTNIGQIGDALLELEESCAPDRIVIETSGSAEPLKLVLEINRLSAVNSGRYELDGVISVIDAENWGGYADSSFTARLQARQTDLVVLNKWEGLGERELDVLLDRLGDLDVQTPVVRSERGFVSPALVFGFDAKMARGWVANGEHGHGHDHGGGDGHEHTSEIECLSVTLTSSSEDDGVDIRSLEELLKAAPKDEVYRIKALLYSFEVPDEKMGVAKGGRNYYILNWAFGRWSWSISKPPPANADSPVLRMSVFTAPYESNKWMKRLKTGGNVKLSHGHTGVADLQVKRVQ